MSFVKYWQAYNYKDLTVGYESMHYGESTLFDYAYVSCKWIFNLPSQDYYGIFVKGGPLAYSNYTYLSGPQIQVNLFYSHNITRDLTLYLEAGGDKTFASQPAYTSNSLGPFEYSG